MIAGNGFGENGRKISYKLIFNPKAGGGRAYQVLSDIKFYFRKYAKNYSLDIYETSYTGDATKEAKKAPGEYDVVIAAGGDGTINEIINGLVNTNTALGIIPVGTANVFASEQGIDSIEKAVKAIVKNEVRKIDVGEANGTFFLSWLGCGIDSHVLKFVEAQTGFYHHKRSFGIIAYIVYGFKSLFFFKPRKLYFKLEGKSYKAYHVLVSNIKTYGQRYLFLAPYAKLDDGCLDVTLFLSKNKWSIFRYAYKLAEGKHLHLPDVVTFKARNMWLTSKKPVYTHKDGDLFEKTPVRIRVWPKALKVIL